MLWNHFNFRKLAPVLFLHLCGILLLWIAATHLTAEMIVWLGNGKFNVIPVVAIILILLFREDRRALR